MHHDIEIPAESEFATSAFALGMFPLQLSEGNLLTQRLMVSHQQQRSISDFDLVVVSTCVLLLFCHTTPLW